MSCFKLEIRISRFICPVMNATRVSESGSSIDGCM